MKLIFLKRRTMRERGMKHYKGPGAQIKLNTSSYSNFQSGPSKQQSCQKVHLWLVSTSQREHRHGALGVSSNFSAFIWLRNLFSSLFRHEPFTKTPSFLPNWVPPCRKLQHIVKSSVTVVMLVTMWQYLEHSCVTRGPSPQATHWPMWCLNQPQQTLPHRVQAFAYEVVLKRCRQWTVCITFRIFEHSFRINRKSVLSICWFIEG